MDKEIQALVFDIDGVITDGKKYTDGISREIKSMTYKDLDAIKSFKKNGILVGCISGEDTSFSRMVAENLDFYFLGKKNKKEVLQEFADSFQIERERICYVGDGKYDIEVLKFVGLAACPHDAIQEVKNIVDIILRTPGGGGCIAELYTKIYQPKKMKSFYKETDIADTIKDRINSHYKMVERSLKDENLIDMIGIVCQKIVDSLKNGGQLLFCGNGGSAADAQHLAAEFIGKFYLERQAYAAEALSVNTSAITALANDYDYNIVFARQVAAKGRSGDILVGITTSGKSENILRAFKQAKKDKIITVLITGNINEYLLILEYTDYVLRIPSSDVPRIQEGHILIGHIICEMVESKLAEEE